MINRLKIKMIVRTFVLVFLMCKFSYSQSSNKSEQINVIVFLIDDMGLMDTSVPFILDENENQVIYPQNNFYKTPNMEKLSEQGIRFINFYAHSVSSPSRASLLTGQNSARHGITNWIRSENNNRTEFGPSEWNWQGLTKESVTLPRLLKQKGYKTIHVGKAHFGPFDSEGADPKNLGFDVNIAGSSIGEPGSYYGKDGFGHLNGYKPRAVQGLEKYHGKDIFLTEALTLEAKNAIANAHKEEKPFFMYFSHYAVHDPFQSDPRFADNYKNSNKNEKAKAFATLIEGIDKSLGDIVQYVRDLGLGENTLILFMGDNGSDSPLPDNNLYGSSFPLKGKKGHHWEGGMRVPFIASWITPDKNSNCQKKIPVRSNSIQKQQGSVIDIFPTVCRIANVDIPDEHIIDGYNLKELLDGKHNSDNSEIFLNHFPHGNHRTNYFTSLVIADWKVIYHYQVEGKQKYELFNLKNDPFETNNLADDNPKQLKTMMIRLINELQDKNALYPEKDGIPVKPILPDIK